jgi:glycosyltransferase involved in cell wall biosynthesis
MRIVILHPDVCVMAGNTRLMFMLADVFKALGHRVTIVGRHYKETRARVILKTPFGFQRLTSREGMLKKHYDIEDFAKYHPVKHLTLEDIRLEGIPVTHPFLYFPQRVEKLLWKADIVWTDAEIYVKLPERVRGIEGKQVQYVHFPLESLKPVEKHSPCAVWCNSLFTQRHVKMMWNLDADVVYPPLHCDLYRNSNGFEEREYDVVMFARLHPDKFESVLPFLKDFKVAVVGSAYGYEKDLPEFVTLYKDATWQEAVSILARSKVYIHAKGFGEYDQNRKSLPEHFGQTIVEAMASGCVPVVPSVGGPLEIVGEQEQYGFWFKDIGGLIRTIKEILENREFWRDCSMAALKRARVFDATAVSKRVQQLLEKMVN